MKLEGLHHITMITGDARRNVEFYADVLGLRMVKKTVNFDQPSAYHLYLGDEQGSPGSILTWFEFPGAAPGRAGAGMIHTIALGVASEDTLGFWSERLRARGYQSTRDGRSLRFEDYDGLGLELAVADDGNPPLRAAHPEIPAERAIVGIEGARAYGRPPTSRSRCSPRSSGSPTRAEGRTGSTDSSATCTGPTTNRRTAPGRQGAGTVHHIAWASQDGDHLRWRKRAREGGAHVTEVRDRDYFRSIYFREPGGILFEIATLSPGFAVDEDPGRLGEELRVPLMHAHLREQLERSLTPVVNPRTARREDDQ